MSFIDKLETAVNLPLVLRILGCVIMALTVWKGVHGFWPTFGIVAGTLAFLVGSRFNKIYK